jgi:hypothetical protein
VDDKLARTALPEKYMKAFKGRTLEP